MDLYRYKLDGIVGHRLIDAVIRFQTQSGLPVTGFPDPATLFLVCHQNAKVTHG
jgi:peptidoglycan hydrolase-like protein with peptidoglycan-binding domain